MNPHSPAVEASLSCPGCGAGASPGDSACRYCSRVLSLVGCNHCFARLFTGMQFCPQCGTRSGVGATDGDEGSLACPGCGDHHCTSLLAPKTVGKEPLHECLACHGIWLSSHTVDSITSDVNARALFAPDVLQGTAAKAQPSAPTAKPGTAFRYRRCPKCARMMSRVNIAKISGIIVDRCPQHGTFFDMDELHALVKFLEQGGLDRARAREREALSEERRRLQMLMDIDQRRRSLEYAPAESVPSTGITVLLGALLRRVSE